jgi:HlyD family secretion protein
MEETKDEEGESGELVEDVKPKNEKRHECVFVKSGDKVKLRIVQTGIQDDTYIEIISGLKKGETIVTGPYTVVSKELNPGDKVRVKTKAELEEERKKAKKES